MSRRALRVRDYLEHILTAIARISEYTSRVTAEEFLSNRLVQDAVIRNIEIIGEAARNNREFRPVLCRHKLRLAAPRYVSH